MITTDTETLTAHFVDNWEGPLAIYPNQPKVELPEGEAWCRFCVVLGASFHAAGSSQTGIFLQQGRVWLQVFVPEQTGVGLGNEIRQAFCDLFRHQTLGAVRCKMPEYDASYKIEDGFIMLTVSVPWESRRRY